jgi:hypothetical protein
MVSDAVSDAVSDLNGLKGRLNQEKVVLPPGIEPGICHLGNGRTDRFKLWERKQQP